MRNQFGGKATKANLEQYAQSKNWSGKQFENLEETIMSLSFQDIPKLLYKQFCEKNGREPIGRLPVVPFDKEAFLAPADKAKFCWYGHSVILMRVENKTILIDPMLGSDASPIAPFKTKRFSENTLSLIDDFPEIDLLLMTHDHYDHLDYDSIQKLKPKVKKYWVALGVGRHLVKWGVDENDITEFDWWDQQPEGDIQITFTPTRHFSGRGLRDRFQGLWGGWVIKTASENIYFSGDGGYGPHFKTVGERLGPFNFAFMECGQYNELWSNIHLFPEESVQAGIDAGAEVIMPVHWGGFSLSTHPWKAPVEGFVEAAMRQNMPFMVPQLGEMFTADEAYSTAPWWQNLT